MLFLVLALETIVPMCRCSEVPLDDYFARADIVVLARVNQIRRVTPDRVEIGVTYILRPNQPLKGSLTGITLATTISSASCGVSVEVGHDYVFFASKGGPDDPGIAWFTTCSGTRQYPTGGENAPSFIGTPDNKVVLRLFELADGNTTAVDSIPCAGLSDRVDTLRSTPKNMPARGEDKRFARLLPRTAAYLDADWNGRVFETPGGKTYRVSAMKGRLSREEYAIDLVERRRIGGIWWLHVRIYDESPCKNPAARPTHGGWVPAYSSRGRLVGGTWPGGC